jgi:hypothetical protein
MRLLLGLIANLTVLGISLVTQTQLAIAEPAPVFKPILKNIQNRLPRGTVMRLPASLERIDWEGKRVQLYPLSPSAEDGGLVIRLTNQPGCDALACLSGYLAAYPSNSSYVDSSFRKNLNLDLGNGIRGNYYEKGCSYYDPMIGRGARHGVVWQQDNTIFVVQSGCSGEPEFDARDKQRLINMAASMVRSSPIRGNR